MSVESLVGGQELPRRAGPRFHPRDPGYVHQHALHLLDAVGAVEEHVDVGEKKAQHLVERGGERGPDVEDGDENGTAQRQGGEREQQATLATERVAE